MKESQQGTVYLVGAGPGDPELLTVKAANLLRKCDALLYDSLIPEEMLELVSESCECIFVGKRRGHHSVPQVKTNSILLKLVKKHSCIVRLKGGDPFLFGRGGEEAAFLASHGVSVEVVPGITAGIAVPAYVGIPITHRHAGSSVTFVTGHEGIDTQRSEVNWRSLAKSTDGLVIYMGLHNLDFIIEELLSGGLDPEIPSVVIQQGTVVGQRYLRSPLNQLSNQIKKHRFLSPSIVMIGKAVAYQIPSCSPKPALVTMPIVF